jgi:hypothetical protein
LQNLNQIQQYFEANNIHSITKQPNGDLLISFNRQNSQSNQPTSQTITEQQITNETDANMDSEQRTM